MRKQRRAGFALPVHELFSTPASIFDFGVETDNEQAMPGLDTEAIDFRAASELLAPARKLERADLETLRLVTRHQGR